MLNVIRCPFCNAKYKITNTNNGQKLKCTGCKKIIGIILDGHLLPMLETFSPKAESTG